jgi:hypothetical protein
MPGPRDAAPGAATGALQLLLTGWLAELQWAGLHKAAQSGR